MSFKRSGLSWLIVMGIAGLTVATLPITPAIAQGSDAKPTLPIGTVTTDPCNNNLAIQVASDGRFNQGAYPDPATCGAGPSSFNLSYDWPGLPGTSFDTVRVDGSDYVYGSIGSVIAPPADINPTTNQSSWQITPGIKDTQTLSIVNGPSTGNPDTALIQSDITNTDSVPHQVGLRVMIDTMLNNNDGAPFFIPGAGAVTTETDFSGAAVPQYWQAFYSLTSSSQFSSQGTLIGDGATTPDRFVVASWPNIHSTLFDYTVTPGLPVTSDSAVAMYWLPKTLAPGATLHLATLYGLSGFTQDLSPPLALSITAPASLTTTSSGGYTPNPFTVSAFTQNVGTATASAASMTLNLPPGLALAPGQAATYQAGDLAPGATAQTSWQVIAAPQATATTLAFSVTASAGNASSKSVSRGIAVPAGHPQCNNVTANVARDPTLVSAMNVSGTCFAPGERVDVLLNTEAGAILLGTINAAADGSVSANDINGVIVPRSFRIPLTPGAAGRTNVTVPVRSGFTYQLEVIGSTSGNGVSMQVQFQFDSAGTLASVSATNPNATVGTNCAPPPAVAGPPVPLPGPLHTNGRWIENASGARVKLVSVNWYGAEQADLVPGGLDCQRIDAIAREIGDGGFNSVRLPWSNAMLEEDPSVCSQDTLDRPCIDPAFLRANPQLMSDDALGILQAAVSALRQADVMVVLDNHTTDAQWAPGPGNGVWWGGRLWDDLSGTSGPHADWKSRDEWWKDDWIRMVGLFTQPNVIGVDLRNEPDANNSYGLSLKWGKAARPRTRQAWGPTAEWAGNAVLAADANLLVMVEGLANSGDFTRVYCPARSACPGALKLIPTGHLVYSPHSYSNYAVGSDQCVGQSAKYQDLNQDQLACALGHAWGFILTQGQPYTAPVWIGEWGVCNTSDSCAVKENRSFRDNFIAYLERADEDWAYWPLNGTHSNGGSSSLGATWFTQETYGILNPAWNGPQNPSMMSALTPIQACHQHRPGSTCWPG